MSSFCFVNLKAQIKSQERNKLSCEQCTPHKNASLTYSECKLSQSNEIVTIMIPRLLSDWNGASFNLNSFVVIFDQNNIYQIPDNEEPYEIIAITYGGNNDHHFSNFKLEKTYYHYDDLKFQGYAVPKPSYDSNDAASMVFLRKLHG